VINAVGAGVDDARLGERVWVWNAAWQRAEGTAAEVVVLPQHQAVRLPDGVPDEAGACLGIPALTAWHAVHCTSGVAGKSVLIHGGAGSLGQYALQMSRLSGARRIITTVSSDEKGAIARGRGADVVLNYRTDPVQEQVRALTGRDGVHRVIEVEFSANVELDFAVVGQDGELIVYGSDAGEVSVPFAPAIVKDVNLQFFIAYNLSAADRQRAVCALTRLLEADTLEHCIAATEPLERTAEARGGRQGDRQPRGHVGLTPSSRLRAMGMEAPSRPPDARSGDLSRHGPPPTLSGSASLRKAPGPCAFRVHRRGPDGARRQRARLLPVLPTSHSTRDPSGTRALRPQSWTIARPSGSAVFA
jgi:NADPH:quinone reductase